MQQGGRFCFLQVVGGMWQVLCIVGPLWRVQAPQRHHGIGPASYCAQGLVPLEGGEPGETSTRGLEALEANCRWAEGALHFGALQPTVPSCGGDRSSLMLTQTTIKPSPQLPHLPSPHAHLDPHIPGSM